MRPTIVLVLRVVVALCLLGSLVVQLGLLPMVWMELSREPAAFRVPVVGLVAGGILCLQVVGVCTWLFLSAVRRGTVFSRPPLRPVGVVIAALATLSALILGLAVVARFANHAVPGVEIAPGLVALICGASLVVAGIALLVVVLRGLLVRAAGLEAELRGRRGHGTGRVQEA